MTMHGPVRATPRAKPHIMSKHPDRWRFKIFFTYDLRDRLMMEYARAGILNPK